MIKKYKKKPITIEAIQWDGETSTYLKISKFINDKNILSVDVDEHLYEAGAGAPYVTEMRVKTLEGNMLVNKTDYVVKGVLGEFYPVTEDIFKKTYQKTKTKNVYTKKPVVIEAVQFTRDNIGEVTSFLGGTKYQLYPSDDEHQYYRLYLVTNGGTLCADENDYIIRGIQGEVYPCKPSAFMYDEVK